MSDADIIRRLREENDELRETIRQMKERDRAEASAKADRLPVDWAISPTVRAILIELSSGQTVPLRRLWELAANRFPESVGRDRKRIGGETWNPEQCIRTAVCRNRPALAEIGVEIKNKWGVGYYLPPESLKIVRKALKPRDAD